MVKRFFKNGKNILSNVNLKRSAGVLYGKQSNILSAAVVIMVMIALSRILGLIRNRIFVHYFTPRELDSYLAAFQLPDLIFEVLVLGAMSSAFIPIFTKKLTQKNEKEAWYLAGLMLNVMLILFLALSVIIFLIAHPLYDNIAQGFTIEQVNQTVLFTKYLLIAQMFFAASYVFTAILESHQRFLTPAIAPLFYNLGIILATIFGAPTFGLLAPILGAVFGSFLHLLIQIPLALKLGFRPAFSLNFKDTSLKQIAKLALPRIIELSSLQIKRLVDLFLASLVAGGLTYFKFADSIAVLPISLFGLAIAKASLPQLSRETAGENLEKFKSTFATAFKQIIFFVVPASVFLEVLRIPIVRLAFGGSRFGWEDTVQTGYVLSAFAIGIFAYSLSLLVSRGFYALHDTITPVKVSFITILFNIALGMFLVRGLGLDIWSLALAYSLAGILQLLLLFKVFSRKVNGLSGYDLFSSFAKVTSSAAFSGVVMFVALKILDRTVWDKKLSFLGKLGLALPTTFDKFVLDTRYTYNLIILTIIVATIGLLIYLLCTWFLGVRELSLFLNAVKKLSLKAYFNKKTEVKKETITSPGENGN